MSLDDLELQLHKILRPRHFRKMTFEALAVALVLALAEALVLALAVELVLALAEAMVYGTGSVLDIT